MPEPKSSKRFQLVLIKPSHYDDDGYLIQWLRSAIPSNTLAVMNGLAVDRQQRRVLGDDVDIEITAYDETNTRVRVPKIVRQLRGGHGLVVLVGVQSNQYPRALDIARPLRAADVQVCMGGFHVSGCLSMLPAVPPELQEAMDMGISLFAGEAEGRFEEVLRHAGQGALQDRSIAPPRKCSPALCKLPQSLSNSAAALLATTLKRPSMPLAGRKPYGPTSAANPQ